jgi:hypothetical protein
MRVPSAEEMTPARTKRENNNNCGGIRVLTNSALLNSNNASDKTWKNANSEQTTQQRTHRPNHPCQNHHSYQHTHTNTLTHTHTHTLTHTHTHSHTHSVTHSHTELPHEILAGHTTNNTPTSLSLIPVRGICVIPRTGTCNFLSAAAATSQFLCAISVCVVCVCLVIIVVIAVDLFVCS